MILLDRPIEWQKCTRSADEYGQMIETWSTHKTIWAMLMPLRGYQGQEATQKVFVGKTRFIVRWDSDMLELDRIKDGSKIMEIESMQEYQESGSNSTRKAYVAIDCTDRDSENTGRDD